MTDPSMAELVFYEEEAELIGFKGEAPQKSRPSDAAFDLVTTESRTIAAGWTARLKVELWTQIPPGYTGLILSRSGLASKGIIVLNAPGVIDPGYRGQWEVILHNLGREAYHINAGDRIAQLLIIKLPLVQFVGLAELTDTDRGEGGFGSTGR